MKNLDNKVAVVTGGGRGIGAAIACKLAGLGASVVVCGRTRGPLESTTKSITQGGSKAVAIECDVTNLRSVESLAQHVESNFGRLDVLVNNSGIGSFKNPLPTCPTDEWDKVLNTNLRGVFYCIRSFAPLMIHSGGGHIVNISSLAGKNPLPNGAAYAASQRGLNGLRDRKSTRLNSSHGYISYAVF